MKNLELENLGVEEMSSAEMAKVEGGGLLSGLLGGVGGTGIAGALNAVIADTTSYVNKTLANVMKLVSMQ